MHARPVLALAAALWVLGGCGDGRRGRAAEREAFDRWRAARDSQSAAAATAGRARVARELPARERQWAARGPAAYRVRVSDDGCRCPPRPPVVVTVRGGVVTSVADTLGRPAPDSLAGVAPYAAVPRLFAALRAWSRPDARRSLSADFDPALGYPTRVSVGGLVLPHMGLSLRLSDLAPVDP